jgi:hypothetical protein
LPGFPQVKLWPTAATRLGPYPRYVSSGYYARIETGQIARRRSHVRQDLAFRVPRRVERGCP